MDTMIFTGVALALPLFVAIWLNGINNRYRLPPGPIGFPLIGTRNMPSQDEAIVFTEWSKRYGPVMYIPTLLGSGFLVLSDFQSVKALLEQKSSIYVDRPYAAFMRAIGMDWMLTQLSGEKFRSRRAVVQKSLSPSIAQDQQQIQEHESMMLLQAILDDPKAFLTHLRRFAADLVLLTTYGYRAGESNSLIANINQSQSVTTRMGPFMRLLLTMVPVLRHYPRWLPFSNFRKLCDTNYELNQKIRNEPFEIAKSRLYDRGTPNNLVASLIQDMDSNPSSDPLERSNQMELIKDTAGIMYFAAADATSETLTVFFLAMALNQRVVRKAQAEIDAVTGSERLPSFHDRPNLPYIDAIILEVFRWHCVTPLGFPRTPAQDDVYQGYKIPKGTITFGNTWSMYRDESLFPSPEEFIPERFLEGDAVDKELIAARKEVVHSTWGWGRRICPGRHSADNALFISISHILSVFNISPIKDGELVPKFSRNRIRRALPFECNIQPRSDHTTQLIRMAEL